MGVSMRSKKKTLEDGVSGENITNTETGLARSNVLNIFTENQHYWDLQMQCYFKIPPDSQHYLFLQNDLDRFAVLAFYFWQLFC